MCNEVLSIQHEMVRDPSKFLKERFLKELNKQPRYGDIRTDSND